MLSIYMYAIIDFVQTVIHIHMYAIIDCKIGVSSYSRYNLNIPSGTFSEQHYISIALNL